MILMNKNVKLVESTCKVLVRKTECNEVTTTNDLLHTECANFPKGAIHALFCTHHASLMQRSGLLAKNPQLWQFPHELMRWRHMYNGVLSNASPARPLLRIRGINILQRQAVGRRTGGQRRGRQRHLQRGIRNVGKNERRPCRTNYTTAGGPRAGRSRMGHRRRPIYGDSVDGHLCWGANFERTPA
jgi:hypothetical protein